jgi:hypothetical protein
MIDKITIQTEESMIELSDIIGYYKSKGNEGFQTVSSVSKG